MHFDMSTKYEFTTFNTHGDGKRYDRNHVVSKFADLYTHGWAYVGLLEDDDGSFYLFKREKPKASYTHKTDF